jgi:thiol-disulfide isomerase/thioredoxin
MNKRLLIIVGTILTLITVSLTYLIINKDADTTDSKTGASSSTSVDTNNGTAADQQQSSSADSYVDYRDGIIADTSGTKLLFFHAPWCPQCRALEADIKSQGVPDGVSIIKVDYDNNQQLRREYGVTIQTTVVRVDDDGKLVEKFVAYDDPSLDAVIKELL